MGYGRDSQDYLVENEKTQSRLLKFFQYEYDFGNGALAGLYFGGQQPERYVGVYGETPIVGKLSVLGEYVHNNNKTKPAENGIGYGYTAYDDYVTQDGLKGFGLVLDYMTSDHTKLSLERYWAHTKPRRGIS